MNVIVVEIDILISFGKKRIKRHLLLKNDEIDHVEEEVEHFVEEIYKYNTYEYTYEILENSYLINNAILSEINKKYREIEKIDNYISEIRENLRIVWKKIK
jgi:hypothetical protein